MPAPTGILFDIRKFSIHDGPGIRTTVFFKGCPLRCVWCHNPESQARQPELMLHPRRCIACSACQEACPQSAIVTGPAGLLTDRRSCRACGQCVQACYADARQLVGRRYGLAEVLESLERDSDFYAQSGGGVTFSGGEPLMQGRFLLALLQAARAAGWHTALDTCGYAAWELVEQVRPYVDLFLYDLKLIDPLRHRQATGVSNRRILDNLGRLSALGHAIILRLPLIPGINTDMANLEATARFAAALPSVQQVDLLPYHAAAETKYRGLGREYPLPELEPLSQAHLQTIQALFAGYGLNVACSSLE